MGTEPTDTAIELRDIANTVAGIASLATLKHQDRTDLRAAARRLREISEQAQTEPESTSPADRPPA